MQFNDAILIHFYFPTDKMSDAPCSLSMSQLRQEAQRLGIDGSRTKPREKLLPAVEKARVAERRRLSKNHSIRHSSPLKERHASVNVRGHTIDNTETDRMYNLLVMPSGIPNAGNGLYAGHAGFKKGEIVGEYSRYDGRLTVREAEKEAELAQKRGVNNHAYWEYAYANKKYVWNMRIAYDVLVRYANDARSSRNNAHFDEFGGRVFMIATRNIPPYAEVFCDYGPDYWSGKD